MILNTRLVGMIIALGLISTNSSAEFGIFDTTLGYEVGIENQVETIDGNDYVRRLYGRALGTYEGKFYKNKRGDAMTVELRAGGIAGSYKGGTYINPEFGSQKRVHGGVTGELAGLYSFGEKKVRPFVGIDTKFEMNNQARIDWQGDALIGAKIKVGEDKTVGLRYQYIIDRAVSYPLEGRAYVQDKGFGLQLVVEKERKTGGSDAIKLEWEKLEASEVHYFNDGWVGYEPDSDHVMMTYQRKF